jgi:hypothetical protein
MGPAGSFRGVNLPITFIGEKVVGPFILKAERGTVV